jgi:hypothetical protein
MRSDCQPHSPNFTFILAQYWSLGEGGGRGGEASEADRAVFREKFLKNKCGVQLAAAPLARDLRTTGTASPPAWPRLSLSPPSQPDRPAHHYILWAAGREAGHSPYPVPTHHALPSAYPMAILPSRTYASPSIPAQLSGGSGGSELQRMAHFSGSTVKKLTPRSKCPFLRFRSLPFPCAFASRSPVSGLTFPSGN